MNLYFKKKYYVTQYYIYVFGNRCWKTQRNPKKQTA